MGISGLFPLIKKHSKRVKLTEFCGQTGAVDASCWIHKALASSLAETGTRERAGQIFQKHLNLLKKFGIFPYVVFDGQKLPAKSDVNAKRQRERDAKRKQASSSQNDNSTRNKLLAQSASITFEDITMCIKLCLNQDIPYIVAPYEADAQITLLLNKGHVNFAISEDSDLLAYGCQKVLTKLNFDGFGEFYCLGDVLKDLNIDMEQFVDACITAGCDYLQNVKGIGIHKALGIQINQRKSMFTILTEKGAPPDYESKFQMAKSVFNHQTVIDPEELKAVPLKNWLDPPSRELQHYCGDITAGELTIMGIAVGNVDHATGRTINFFPPFKKKPICSHNQPGPELKDLQNCIHNQDNKNAHLPSSHLDLEIIKIEDASISWEIPCFPLICLNFTPVRFAYNGKEYDGLVKTEELISVGAKKCLSHYPIEVHGHKYEVLWKFEDYLLQPLESSNQLMGDNEVASDDSNCSDVQDDDCIHTLPFKVLGSCYSADRQKALEEAYEYLYEYNRPIFAKIQAEPENIHDDNAIAVYILADDTYKKVGYIASELTQYVHPHIRSPEFEVDVKSIRYRTTFLMIGYYLTVTLSKSGFWNNNIVKASKYVK